MKRPAGELAHRLAAEYVVGTLRGRARRRFEGWMREDAALAAIVRQWEDGLTPLAARVAPVEPPARVWRAIEARIAASRVAPRGSFWSSLAFWRTFGSVAGGLAVMLMALFLWLSQGPRGEPLFIAVLTTADQDPHVLVSMHSPDILRVRMVKPVPDGEGHDLQLWVVAGKDEMRSLGVMPNHDGDTIIHLTSADPRVRGARALAITLEPRGGAPQGKPSGPPVLTGPIIPVRKA